MSGILNLELRRNSGLLLLPFVAGIVAFTTYETLPKGIWLWEATGLSIRMTLALVSPVAAGFAVWAAGRDRRCGMEDLLRTTARSALARDLGLWAATTAWLLLAFAVPAALFLVFTYLGATGGEPAFASVYLSFTAVLASATMGFVVGSYVKSRFAAPLFAIIFYLIQGVLAYNLGASSARFLSPLMTTHGSELVEPWAKADLPQAIWLLCLTGGALGLLTLRRWRGPSSWAVLSTSLAVALCGAALVLMRVPGGYGPAVVATVPYEPVCEGERVPVCVHPAYRALLPEAVGVVEKVSAPLVGLPRGPSRARQEAISGTLMPDGTIPITIYDESTTGDVLAYSVATALTYDDASLGRQELAFMEGSAAARPAAGDDCAEEGGPESAAQLVFRDWLLMRAAAKADGQLHAYCPDTRAALQRFAALSPMERDGWLERNYADLRAGRLSLEDLP